jgi:hypothetical protein
MSRAFAYDTTTGRREVDLCSFNTVGVSTFARLSLVRWLAIAEYRSCIGMILRAAYTRRAAPLAAAILGDAV